MRQVERHRRKVSQQVLRVLDENWQSFLTASKAYRETPDKFTARPKLPKYKHKNQGRNLLIYRIQAISKTGLKQGIVKLSGTDITVKTLAKNIAQARIIPKDGSYNIMRKVIPTVFDKGIEEAACWAGSST